MGGLKEESSTYRVFGRIEMVGGRDRRIRKDEVDDANDSRAERKAGKRERMLRICSEALIEGEARSIDAGSFIGQ